MHEILISLLLFVFIVHSGFFSSSEISFAKSNKLRAQMAAENGDKTAHSVCFINDHYVQSLSTILVGNNLVNIAASSAATMLMTSQFGREKGPAIASVGITILLLIFGETIPKIVAAAAPDRAARLFCRPLRFFMVLFAPIVWIVSQLVALISPLWTPKQSAPPVTSDELCEILEDIEEEGVFTETEGELIRSAIEFTETAVYEILTPRIDVVALDADDTDFTTLDVTTLRHSRVPVYRGSIDHIIGILSTRQLLKERILGHPLQLERLLIPPLYVHKTCPVSAAIESFRKQHVHMAIVLDEYGGTLGILTLEDIVEELVGEIYDEKDVRDTSIQKKSDREFVVDGRVNIYDLFDRLHYEPPSNFRSRCTTVGGWATEMLDRLPVSGDAFTYDRLHLIILSAAVTRVKTLRVELHDS